MSDFKNELKNWFEGGMPRANNVPTEQATSTNSPGGAVPDAVKCCEFDTDGDGNCHIHEAPGVFRNKALQQASECAASRDQELDTKVAELVMEWEQIVEGRGLWKHPLGYTLCTEGTPGIFVSHWNPSTNLNDCFEAQSACIKKVGWSAFEYELLKGETDAEAALLLFATATARQRCEAMLLAMGSPPLPTPSTLLADLGQSEKE